MYSHLLFDLDGTLTDPGEGITNSVAHALKKRGIEVADHRELNCFIGPPLAQSFMKYYGLSEEDLASRGLLTYGSNVKEVTTQVKEAMVSCGIVYSTDAFSAGLTVVDTATAQMCGQVIYPAAIIRTTEHQAAAESFLEYLRSHEADEVFSAVGFTPIA